jgi:hypothetical protein
MKLTIFVAFASLTLAGCAGMDAAECRAADWHGIGFRDGLTGMQKMDFVYDHQCGRHGARLDQVAYVKGWQEGLWEFDRRKAHGGEE